jgi:hypothetical protein
LIPIDVGAEAGITEALSAATEAIGGPVGRFAGELLRSLAKTFRPALFGPAHMPLNDPVAAMVAADPQLASTRPARVEIRAQGRAYLWPHGLIDFALRSGRAANADVVIGLDGRGVSPRLRRSARPPRRGQSELRENVRDVSQAVCILMCGEILDVGHSIHQKGFFDSFPPPNMREGVAVAAAALEGAAWDITYQPRACGGARSSRSTQACFRPYDCVMLSDIGSNTLLLLTTDCLYRASRAAPGTTPLCSDPATDWSPNGWRNWWTSRLLQ